METTNANLLQDVEQEISLQPASLGMRLVNYIIDVIFFYLIVFVGAFSLLGISVAQGGSLEDNVFTQETTSALGMQYLISFSTYFLYYFLFEYFGKGRTIGKLITRTQVKRTDGGSLTVKDVLIRTIVRFVPFEAFSGFFGGFWHDRWSSTVVAKKI